MGDPQFRLIVGEDAQGGALHLQVLHEGLQGLFHLPVDFRRRQVDEAGREVAQQTLELEPPRQFPLSSPLRGDLLHGEEGAIDRPRGGGKRPDLHQPVPSVPVRRLAQVLHPLLGPAGLEHAGTGRLQQLGQFFGKHLARTVSSQMLGGGPFVDRGQAVVDQQEAQAAVDQAEPDGRQAGETGHLPLRPRGAGPSPFPRLLPSGFASVRRAGSGPRLVER